MKKYLFVILFVGLWSCDDGQTKSLNGCSEIITNANEATSSWSVILDYNMANDEYPEDAKNICNAYFDAIITLKESNCVNDMDGWENYTLLEVEDLRLSQCDL